MKRIRAVGIVIDNDKSTVLLMHRKRDGREFWVFPGGGVEEGESVEEAVRRELREETTIEISIERLLYHHIYPDQDSEQFFYRCSYISGIPHLGQGSDEAKRMQQGLDYYDPCWVGLDAIRSLVLYPLEIRDWLLEDLANGFSSDVKTATLLKSEIRKAL